ncbi:MAG: amidotransferase [Thermoleophilia bacterium]|nr:amidotransferase [Thermoleophilia bacterium]
MTPEAAPTIHVLQHAERVRPLTVAEWGAQRGVDLRVVRVDLEPLPSPADVTHLVVLGGGMNTDEAHLHPWLDAERSFLADVLRRGTARVLGICLGSQLLAEVLGGSTGRAAVPEIGWQRIRLTEAGRRSPVFGALPSHFDAMEWHGDAWTLPPGAELTATADGCEWQAFSHGELVHGVQFHPEFTLARTTELAASTTDDLSRGGCVQRPEQFLDAATAPARFDALREVCMALLDAALLPAPG